MKENVHSLENLYGSKLFSNHFFRVKDSNKLIPAGDNCVVVEAMEFLSVWDMFLSRVLLMDLTKLSLI